MPNLTRPAVIYRSGLRKMSTDKNAGRPGYAPCTRCKVYARVLPSGRLIRHNLSTRRSTYIQCHSTDAPLPSLMVAMNQIGVGQQRIADTLNTTRYQVRVTLGKV